MNLASANATPTTPPAPRTTLTSAQVRELDARAEREYGLPGLVLMENAGAGCAQRLLQFGLRGRILIVCGSGNNGGDGLVIARHLDNAGHLVRIVLVGAPTRLSPAAAVQWRAVTAAGLDAQVVTSEQAASTHFWQTATSDCSMIIDAILGTGSQGELRPPLPTVLTHLNHSPAVRIAIDLPTGLNADTGQPGPFTFRAARTLTLVAPKAGFNNPLATEFLGIVDAIPIGVPRRLLLEFLDVTPSIPAVSCK
ncbi:MAG: NAD(P)H-hydrate epimerase [Planctomycetota bacterium]